MTEQLNLDQLLALTFDRLDSKLEIDFAGQRLTVVEAEALPQKHKLLLARAQGELQDYYQQVLSSQDEIREKLKEESLSESDKKRLSDEMGEKSIELATRLINSSEKLMEANLRYIEAVAQLQPGQAKEMIKNAIASLEAQHNRSLSDEQKYRLAASFVARASQLIRAALDDVEKNFAKDVGKLVRGNLRQRETPIERLAIEAEAKAEPIESLLSASAGEQRNTFARL